jgi:hypothetical protein
MGELLGKASFTLIHLSYDGGLLFSFLSRRREREIAKSWRRADKEHVHGRVDGSTGVEMLVETSIIVMK